MLFTLSACKKYEDGGFVFKRIKNLFGDTKDHSKKNWRLSLYEVNGIDSTNLFQGSNLHIVENNFASFYISDSHAKNYYCSTFLYDYSISIDKKSKLLSMGTYLSPQHNDTSQCFSKSGVLYCQRNIFNPEKNKFAEWQIKKLTKDELILSIQLTNTYKIILQN